MDEPGHRSVDFTERVERQENLVRFWLAVYNLRANGGSRNIIAFSYAGCCLYQMEMHLCRVWDQIFSIWIWLHHLTLPFNSNPQYWTGKRTSGSTLYAVWVCTCMSDNVSTCFESSCVSACVYQTVLFSFCTMVRDHGALGSMLLLAGPHALPWGEQLLHKHVGVWATSLWLPPSPSLLLLLVQRHSASDINYLDPLNS